MIIIRLVLVALVLPLGGTSSFVFAESEASCKRLVSLAPSITESIFEIGLGHRLVGVTRYCRFPSAVQDIPKVGGLLDPNLERLTLLKPTVVMHLTEQSQLADQLRRLDIPVLGCDHRSVQGYLNSLKQIGDYCSRAEEAAQLALRLEDQLTRVQRCIAKLPVRRVLLVVGRTGSPESLQGIYLSGGDGFYRDLLKVAGGVNVYGGQTIAMPTVSPEGLLALAPEVIVEVVPDLKERGWSVEQLRLAWKGLPQIPAVSTGRIVALTGSHVDIPGPRLGQAAVDLALLLHPEQRACLVVEVDQ